MEKNKILGYLLKCIKNEIKSWTHFIKSEWAILFLLIVTVISVLYITKPIPPKHVKMVVSSEGSVSEQLGEKFVPYFKKEGVELELVKTDGYGKKMAKIANDQDDIIAGLIVAGISEKEEFSELESIGSMSYAPIWMMYKGDFKNKGDINDYLNGKKIGISPKNTSTYILLNTIFKKKGTDITNLSNIKEIPASEIPKSLINGDIDGAILVEGYDSPRIKELIGNKDIKVFNLDFTEAYIREFPFLTEVSIPKGSFDMQNMSYPHEDVKLLSSSEVLLIDKKTHPAIKELFVESAIKIGTNENQFFSRPGTFPQFNDNNFVRSTEAVRQYKGEKLLMRDKLSLFLSSYIDRMWVLILGTLSILIPIISFLPNYRELRFKIALHGYYESLHNIEVKFHQTEDLSIMNECMKDMIELNEKITNYWSGVEFGEQVYNYKNAVSILIIELENKIKKLSDTK